MDNFFKLRPFRRHLYLESYPQMLWLAPHAGQQKWVSVSNSAMLNRSASQTLPIHSASGRHQCKSSQLCSWVTWRIMHTSSSSQHSAVTVVKVVMVMPLCFSFFFFFWLSRAAVAPYREPTGGTFTDCQERAIFLPDWGMPQPSKPQVREGYYRYICTPYMRRGFYSW